jgi:hypothetical protein
MKIQNAEICTAGMLLILNLNCILMQYSANFNTEDGGRMVF